MSQITQAETAAAKVPVTYIKAMPLKDYEDLGKIREELRTGNVLILKITPLAIKSIDLVKKVIDELKSFVESIDGDIARLGEERIVVTPSLIKIWRRKGSVGD